MTTEKQPFRIVMSEKAEQQLAGFPLRVREGLNTWLELLSTKHAHDERASRATGVFDLETHSAHYVIMRPERVIRVESVESKK